MGIREKRVKREKELTKIKIKIDKVFRKAQRVCAKL